MNIQIYGRARCFDTKKAQRYFKERGIRFQFIEIDRFGLSKGELASVKRAVGGLEPLLDPKAKDYPLIRYLAQEEAKEEKLRERPTLFRTPIVRNGSQATVGYAPEIWKGWK